jgi:hypothetical protein
MTRTEALELIEEAEAGDVEIFEILLDEGFDLEDIQQMFYEVRT